MNKYDIRFDSRTDGLNYVLMVRGPDSIFIDIERINGAEYAMATRDALNAGSRRRRMTIRHEQQTKVVTLECGCMYSANHAQGDRAYTCMHQRIWVVRAETPREILYNVREVTPAQEDNGAD